MPLIDTIRVQHVRPHVNYTLEVAPNVTIITGPNGSGKTSLIEAVYIGLQGSSFKGSDVDVLQKEAPWYRIDIVFSDTTTRTVKFDPIRPNARKQFIVDGKTYYRLPQQYKYPTVLFEPEDLRLLGGSPARRRQFIDTFIARLDPRYAQSLRRYERALKQRNSLLRQHAAKDDTLFAWDVALSEYGAYIIDQRITFVARLNEQLNTTYHTISHTNDTIAIAYSHTSHNTKQKLLADLYQHIEKDKLLGFTSIGPHRHDILFEFNGSPALSVASRGEVRSMVLALKFIEVAITKELTQRKPVILLDDVFSELDPERQNYVVEATKENQIFITSATNNSTIASEHVVRLASPEL